MGLAALVALAALLAAWDQQRARFSEPPGGLVPQSQPRSRGFL
jgi:hypothetical protein